MHFLVSDTHLGKEIWWTQCDVVKHFYFVSVNVCLALLEGSCNTYNCQERARHKVQMGFVGYTLQNASQLPWASEELGIVEYWDFFALYIKVFLNNFIDHEYL